MLILLLQTEAKPIDWLTIILALTSVLGPVFTYLATRRQYSANVDDSTTKTSFLKLDKVVQLMDKVESAQDKYLKLRDQHSRLEQRTRAIEASYSDFYEDVTDVFELVRQICKNDKTKHASILTRIERIEMNGAELAKMKLAEEEVHE